MQNFEGRSVKWALRRPVRMWEDNIKLSVGEIRFEGVGCVVVCSDRLWSLQHLNFLLW
jgi:hypothetical protein